MQIVYVLQHSVTQQIYIGQTNNLKRRLGEHNRHGKSATKRKSGEWILVYAEAYRDKSDALKRETRLKNHGRAKQELFKRIEKSFIA